MVPKLGLMFARPKIGPDRDRLGGTDSRSMLTKSLTGPIIRRDSFETGPAQDIEGLEEIKLISVGLVIKCLFLSKRGLKEHHVVHP